MITGIAESEWKQEYQDYLQNLSRELPFTYSIEKEVQKNWNAIWESEFREIQIDHFCLIRAPFHHSAGKFKYEIVIEPRMAFGTGHHETTRLMIRSMRDLAIAQKKVLDFGAGSGVLAILAAKMGASAAYALEKDDQAFINLEENVLFNHQEIITCLCKDHLMDFTPGSFDVVLANITRNVLVEHVSPLTAVLTAGGNLVLSGFLKKDHEIIVETFQNAGLHPMTFLEENDWIAQTFVK